MAIDPKIFGSKIKDIRLEKHYSLRQVSQQSKTDDLPAISPSYWSLIERGERNIPKRETIARIAHGLREPEERITELAGFLSVDSLPLNVGSGKPTVANVHVPVYGEIHAGAPTYVDENIIGHISVTQDRIDRYGINNLFALRVKGDSMNNEVLNGYVAVFAKDVTIENGDIVAVLIDGDEATIKRYKETSMAYIFEPDSSNPIHQPIVISKEHASEKSYRILGKYLYATNEGY